MHDAALSRGQFEGPLEDTVEVAVLSVAARAAATAAAAAVSGV